MVTLTILLHVLLDFEEKMNLPPLKKEKQLFRSSLHLVYLRLFHRRLTSLATQKSLTLKVVAIKSSSHTMLQEIFLATQCYEDVFFP